MHFFGKNPNPDSESKNRFFRFFGKIQKGIMSPMNPCPTKVQWINPNPDSWDSRLLCCFGKGFEKSPCGKRS